MQIFKGFLSEKIYFKSTPKSFDGNIMFRCQISQILFLNSTHVNLVLHLLLITAWPYSVWTCSRAKGGKFSEDEDGFILEGVFFLDHFLDNFLRLTWDRRVEVLVAGILISFRVWYIELVSLWKKCNLRTMAALF